MIYFLKFLDGNRANYFLPVFGPRFFPVFLDGSFSYLSCTAPKSKLDRRCAVDKSVARVVWNQRDFYARDNCRNQRAVQLSTTVIGV